MILGLFPVDICERNTRHVRRYMRLSMQPDVTDYKLKQLIEHCRTRRSELFYRALHALGDPSSADDAVGNTYAKAFKYLYSFKLGESMSSWLHGILYREIMNEAGRCAQIGLSEIPESALSNRQLRKYENRPSVDGFPVLMELIDEMTKRHEIDDIDIQIFLVAIQERSQERIRRVMRIGSSNLGHRLKKLSRVVHEALPIVRQHHPNIELNYEEELEWLSLVTSMSPVVK